MNRTRRPIVARTRAVIAPLTALALAGCSPAASPEPRAPSTSAEPTMASSALDGEVPDSQATDSQATDSQATDSQATDSQDWGAAAQPEPGLPAAADAAQEPGSPPAGRGSEEGADASEGMISFFEMGRGDRVADLGGLYGYSLEPVLSAVGASGVVYARLRPGLSPDAIPYAQPDPARQGSIVWMKTPLSEPLSPEATRLNVVTLLFAYHSIVAAGHDRKKLNTSVYRSLVPGGTYVIADHAAPPGSGLAAAARLNRIEESIVRAEVEAAGFEFVEAAAFLSNAARAPNQPPPSQYILKFRKPK